MSFLSNIFFETHSNIANICLEQNVSKISRDRERLVVRNVKTSFERKQRLHFLGTLVVQSIVFIRGHWTQQLSNFFNMFLYFLLKQSISTWISFFFCVFKLMEAFAIWITLHLQKETLSFHLETTPLLGGFLDLRKKVSRSSTKCHISL